MKPEHDFPCEHCAAQVRALAREAVSVNEGWLKDRRENEYRAELVADVRIWAESRIEHCREQETKFGHGLGTTKGPPQALIEAWTERRALQAVLDMLDGPTKTGVTLGP